MTQRLEPIEEMKRFMALPIPLPPQAWRAWFAELTPEQREEVEVYLRGAIHQVISAFAESVDLSEVIVAFQNFGQAMADGVASGVTDDQP